MTFAAAAWKLGFDRKTGFLNSLSGEGREWLQSGPRLQIWRGATDNDGIKLWTGQGGKALGRWQEAGLDKMQLQLELLEVVKIGKSGAPIAVRTVHRASGRGEWDDFQHEQIFEIVADGSLHVANRLRLGKKAPTDLPRFGVTLALPAGFEQVRWFGRGPWENYSDRKTSAEVGVYENTVTGLYVPYVMPQEHGNHTDTRWVEVRDTGSSGKAKGSVSRANRCSIFPRAISPPTTSIRPSTRWTCRRAPKRFSISISPSAVLARQHAVPIPCRNTSCRGVIIDSPTGFRLYANCDKNALNAS